MSKRTIIVGFTRPTQPSGCFGCIPAYDHVEVKFSDGYTTSISENHGRVHYVQRSNVHYDRWFELIVDVGIEEEMQLYAHCCWNEKIQFNRIGDMWNSIPLLNVYPILNDGKTFFCTEYVCTILKIGCYCPELLPASTNPTTLWNSLSNDATIKSHSR